MKYVILRAVCKFSDGSLRIIKPFVDLFKIGLQSGCRYTKRETLTFYNDVFDYWEAPPDKTPRIYWKDSFVKTSGIDREALPGYCVPANYNLFDNGRT